MNKEWHDIIVKKDYPPTQKLVELATVYVNGNHFCRDYEIGMYLGNGKWDKICDGDIPTHWCEINVLEEDMYCNNNE